MQFYTNINNVNIRLFSFCTFSKNNFSSKVYNLHSTDDGEPGEQTHGAPNSREHVHKLGRSVLSYSVKCGHVKIDADKSQLQLGIIICPKNIPEIILPLYYIPLNLPSYFAAELSTMYIFLKFLYCSIAFNIFVSNDLSGAYFVKLVTIRPEQGLKIKNFTSVTYIPIHRYTPFAVRCVALW